MPLGFATYTDSNWPAQLQRREIVELIIMSIKYTIQTTKTRADQTAQAIIAENENPGTSTALS